jgi:hypothetical protein
MRPKRKKRIIKAGKAEVVEKRVGTSQDHRFCWHLEKWSPSITKTSRDSDGLGSPVRAKNQTLERQFIGFRQGRWWQREKQRVEGSVRAETKPELSHVGLKAQAYRRGRDPSRETKSQKKGGTMRAIPRGVSTKRGVYRVSKWVRVGVQQGKGAQGSSKALRVERGGPNHRQHVVSSAAGRAGAAESQSLRFSIGGRKQRYSKRPLRSFGFAAREQRSTGPALRSFGFKT